MHWFSSNYSWGSLVPTTAFFGQTLAVLVTFNDYNGARHNEHAITYLPVFLGWR